MINRAIEKIADDVRTAYGQTTAPVDLKKIAEEENIALIAIVKCEGFHGRIEFLRETASFAIYHPDPDVAPNRKRVRFSIAHELGHYFIESHRELLVAGKNHDSTPGFICDNALEVEADEFAAALLIPRTHIERRLQKRPFMTLEEILKMGDEWQSSARSAAIRYLRYTGEACGMVISKQGRITKYIPSDEAVALGFRFTGLNHLPEVAAACRFRNDETTKGKIEEAHITTKAWFPHLNGERDLHEESFRLGGTGYVLSLLSISVDEAEGD
jgi:Zn-dependent peptidase ImmA (M78 family)